MTETEMNFNQAVKELRKAIDESNSPEPDEDFDDYDLEESMNSDELDDNTEIYVDKSSKQQVLDIALEKGLKGEIDQLTHTKIVNRINKNLPLTKSMAEKLGVIELESTTLEVMKKASEEGETYSQSRRKKNNTHSFTNYEGKKITVSKSDIYKKIQKAVASGKMNPLEVTKIERRLNKGQKLGEDFLKSLFLE